MKAKRRLQRLTMLATGGAAVITLASCQGQSGAGVVNAPATNHPTPNATATPMPTDSAQPADADAGLPLRPGVNAPPITDMAPTPSASAAPSASASSRRHTVNAVPE